MSNQSTRTLAAGVIADTESARMNGLSHRMPVYRQRKRDTWRDWIAFLRALFALPLVEELKVYEARTGREYPAEIPHTEAWLVIGCRGGKPSIVGLVAVFVACFRDWRPYLQSGVAAVATVRASDRSQEESYSTVAAPPSCTYPC